MTDRNNRTDLGDQLLAQDYTADRPADSDGVTATDEHAACRFCRETFSTLSGERMHSCPERERLERWSPEDSPPVILSRIHELGAHLLFSHPRDGLSPFFALAKQFDELGHAYQDDPDADDLVTSIEVDGERWLVDSEKTRPWSGGIAGRQQDGFDTFNEYQIRLVSDDELATEKTRKATIQFRPSLPDARTADGSRINSMPEDLPEGVRVQINSSNVEMSEVVPLIRSLAASAGIRPSYFDPRKIHDWSRVYNFALYVRTDRETNEDKITDRNALMDQLARFGSGTRGRGEYKWDNEEIQGHRTAVALDETAWSKLLPNRSVGALLKSYHMKHPEKASSGSPTYHPKIEIQYSTDYSETNSVPWRDDRAYDALDLKRELDENLINALSWSGFDTRANENQYIDDQYFSVEETDRDVRLYENPLEVVEELEGDLATQQFHRTDATNAERDVLATLADGGRHTYEDLADKSGTSESTVYRALDRFGNVVRRLGDGEYALEDDIVAEKFRRLFRTVENAAQYVDRTLDDVISDLDILSEADSPFARWLQTYGAVADDRGERLAVEVGAGEFDKYQIQQILRRGLEAARETGSSLASAFLDAEVAWHSSEDGRRTDRPFSFYGSTVKILGADAGTLR